MRSNSPPNAHTGTPTDMTYGNRTPAPSGSSVNQPMIPPTPIATEVLPTRLIRSTAGASPPDRSDRASAASQTVTSVLSLKAAPLVQSSRVP
jgi:hypothetical protein